MRELSAVEQEQKRLRSAEEAESGGPQPLAEAGAERFRVGDSKRFVSVKKWKGRQMVDVREFYEKDGVLLPGKSGVSLSPEQWALFKALIPDVDKALAKLA